MADIEEPEDDPLGIPVSQPEDDQLVAAAVRRFLHERKGPGDLIPWKWLYDALQVPHPHQINDADARDRWRLRFVSLKTDFSKILLTQHNVALDTVRSHGVRVVPPSEQTGWAEGELRGEMQRSMSKGSARMRHVNLALLTSSEKAANANSLAQFASLRAMIRGHHSRINKTGWGSTR